MRGDFPFTSVSCFCLVLVSTKQLSPFAAFASVFMATDRACEDAVHTSWSGSPPLSSKVGSPHGSGHDLDGMGTGSGDTLDEKLRCPSLKISTLRNADRANPCSYDFEVPCGFTYHENNWGFCDSTYTDGTEFQCSPRTYVQVRDICSFCIKYIRFGTILAYTRTI